MAGESAAVLGEQCSAFGTTSITAERDRRVGDQAGDARRSLQARRGHAMRAILAELQDYADAPPGLVGGKPSKSKRRGKR